MKIRTDFVTNSSSSSFVVEINLELKNNKKISFKGHGAFEGIKEDYFSGDVVVRVSPEMLGKAENVEDLIALLTEGVLDSRDNDKEVKVFNKSNRAYSFIEEIRECVHDMHDIEKISIIGNEYNYINYLRTYNYDCLTGKTTRIVEGESFEKDGSSGGQLLFDDTSKTFKLAIIFKLKDGEIIKFEGHDGRSGCQDYFYGGIQVTVSPRDLGTSANVDEMLSLLAEGIEDYDPWNRRKILSKPMKTKNLHGQTYDAYNFINVIKEKISKIDDVETITIEGTESDKYDDSQTYKKTYHYNCVTNIFSADIVGADNNIDYFHFDSAGHLSFNTFGCIVNGRDPLAEAEKTFPWIRKMRKDWQLAERIETLQKGDTLILKLANNNPKYDYSPELVEIYNTKKQLIGVFTGDAYVSYFLNKITATVEDVTPVSKRRKGAKYALMDIRLELDKMEK